MRATEDPISTFDPVLRDLLLRGLVVQVSGEEGPAWELTPDAQRRLDHVLAVRATPPADRLVYLGRHCAVCGARVLTRLRQGGYVCDPCAESVPSSSPAEEGAAREDPDERRPLSVHVTRVDGEEPGAPLADGGEPGASLAS
jgi:hypothetical protein